jgi:1-acyl-sn-glycerol-3-phosphate acyltransferase
LSLTGNPKQVVLSAERGISPARRCLRVARRFAAVAFCMVACLGEYLVNALTGRTDLGHRAYALHRWSARVLPWLGVRIVIDGRLPENGLLVSNHLSYLDILVFSAVGPCVFVAKREVRSLPGIGWIATLCGTIYIDRSRRSDTHSIKPQMAAALAAGSRLVLFPEGTSSDGRQVLPFRSSLLQPAVENRTPVTAASITYEMDEGDPAVDVCYYGDMTMGPHALKLFGKSGVTAMLCFGGSAQVFSDRKQAAQELYERVSALKSQPAAAIRGVVTEPV